jgi:cell division protein FtsA
MPQRLLGEVLEPRAREMFELIRDHLRQAGVLELCGAGLVLTGGGARMPSLLEVAEDVLRRPARLGYAAPISRMPENLTEPEHAVVIGMLMYAHRARLARGTQAPTFGAKLKGLFAKKGS